MKVLKWILAVVGLAAVIATVVMLFQVSWTMQGILGSANRYNPEGQQQWGDPIGSIVQASALALAAGVLIGLGLGLPTRTRRAVRDEAVNDFKRSLGAEAERERPTVPADQPQPGPDPA